MKQTFSATESASSASDASTTSSPTKRYKSQADDDGAMEPNHKAPRTPPKTTITGAKIVTPASTAKLAVERPSNARRTLGVVDEEKGADYPVVAKKKLPFGATKDSRFIDVGCGLAKPSLHVAQYPGVEFSYGIEVEHVRYMLGMSNLEQVLKAAMKDEESETTETKIGHKCIIEYGDITEAKTFDPFTHVYMFDIG